MEILNPTLYRLRAANEQPPDTSSSPEQQQPDNATPDNASPTNATTAAMTSTNLRLFDVNAVLGKVHPTKLKQP